MSDEKDPVRVGRFEWERLMLMSVPHPTNFKLLPLGVFMSADGGRVRPGNASLAMFGPHEKTWAKLLRWAVAEGWLLLVARGGARRGPEGRTIVRASVYAASVPQSVWERRMEILGAPPFRAASVEGSALDPLKGAPGDSPEGLKGAPDGSPADPDPLKGALETPFNTPDPSLKGAPRDSLPDALKGASEVFEGSDPSFEGSVSGFEGSAQTLPHHVVLSSRSDSSSTSTTTVATEEAGDVSVDVAKTGGGGGGEIDSSEDQEQNDARAEVLLSQLDYRGKGPDKQQQKQLRVLVAAALAAGWSESGLRRYLDISDDANVRIPAALYLHRLHEDRLPDASMGVDPQLPPACWDCLGLNPAAATDLALRVNPITGDACRNCHPGTVGQSPEVPPACDACLEEFPTASTNVRLRYRNGPDGREACPDCHPKRIVVLAAQNGQQGGADGGMWDRAMDRAQQRMQTGDWRGAGPDERVAGWAVVGRQLGAKERPKVGRSYSNEQWRQAADPAEAAKIPHCGDPNCDPVTRLKTESDWTGEPCTTICSDCHPNMKF